MNYVIHYDRLIERARGRVLHGYQERHHVVPKCLGGDNSKTNIVRLTAEEHFVAHQLLVKIYPNNGKLAHAAMAMAKHATGHRAYGWLRRCFAESLRGKKRSPETIEKVASKLRGRPFSEAHRAKLSLALLGNTRTKGKALSIEHKAKLVKSRTGKTHSLETRKQLSAILVARHASLTIEERRLSKLKMWATLRAGPSAGKRAPFSIAHLAKLCVARQGRKPMLGKKHSLETRAKMSLMRKGKPNPRKVALPIIEKMFAPSTEPPKGNP